MKVFIGVDPHKSRVAPARVCAVGPRKVSDGQHVGGTAIPDRHRPGSAELNPHRSHRRQAPAAARMGSAAQGLYGART